jgi:uncharacterized protein (TIGR02246 family)
VRIKLSLVLLAGLAAALGTGAVSVSNGPGKAAGGRPAQDKGRQADREAIEQSSRDFVKAFAKGDARAVAALWTEQGELLDVHGHLTRGRDAIEKAFAEVFKENPGARVEVAIESIRFPAPGLAIEEGFLRQMSAGRELPATTLYSATHVREGGQWKIAATREWGAGQDRLQDLDWLLGKWKATLPDQEVTLSLSRNENKTFLTGRFTRTAKGKVVTSGTMRISQDPQTGQLRSWHFEEDGGHGQALWVRDGNRWVLDSIGVLADGTETHAVNILGRINDDAVTWRSIDRVMGNHELPDTVPIKLRRVPESK